MSSSTIDLDTWSQYSFAPCSPCSSGTTCANEGDSPPSDFPPPDSNQCITILHPNLIDRFPVAFCDLENFVTGRIGRNVDVTIVHLLIYLFSENLGPPVAHINNLKLLHKGRPFSIQRAYDLSGRSPLIKDLIDRFPTFQLTVTATPVRAPLKMTIDSMLLKASAAVENFQSPSITYAEAVVKMLKGSTRKSSDASLDSRSSPTRYASRDSATDAETEDNEYCRPKTSLRNSLKRMFKKPRESGPQNQLIETFLISL
ncbi:hypothetical protein JCM33374_g2673 [Metschnikowia sp. JCM 33374]|nr:hypothetical protein JCM33374_g2673 [Metschnikowia sp. JCM 33374]